MWVATTLSLTGLAISDTCSEFRGQLSTKLYDRRNDQVTLDQVEKIVL